jgi:IclR family acetate operon transcriptional repressor
LLSAPLPYAQRHPEACNSTRVARTGQPSRSRIAAAGRSFAILDVLASAGPLGTNEIARRAGTSASTVSRQLGTLVEAGLVEHVVESGRYRLGMRLIELANAVLATLDVRTVARPHLEALVAEVGETATLSVPAEPDAITVDFVPGHHEVQSVVRLGRPSVAHATAAGKAMLAFAPRRLHGPLTAYTRRTIVDLAQLEHELERIRRRGWADAYEEREPELNAVAAPVYSGAGELAGILALQGPVPRFGHRPARRALPLLLERAGAVSLALGFTRRR